MPQYGSIFDTGTIRTYINVVYVDDTARELPKDQDPQSPTQAKDNIDNDESGPK